MAIKNPDGSIFELKKPNPLLRTQELSKEEHRIHNFGSSEVIVRYRKRKAAPVVSTFPATIGSAEPLPALEGQLEAPKVERPQPVLEPPPVEVVPEVDEFEGADEEIAEEEVDKVSCWCLPGEWKKFHDKLYGETRTNVVWGDKFLFDGVVVDANEMEYKIWTQREIAAPSIIFVRQDRRWWKVVGIQKEGIGHTMTCMPSETRPRFD